MGDSTRRHAGVGFVTELLLESEELLIGSGFKIQRMETKGREDERQPRDSERAA